MLSTLWDSEDATTVRKKKNGDTIEVRCPNVVDIYNKNMSGVALQDCSGFARLQRAA